MPFIPGATYRIQFHNDFKFRDLQPLIPYLAGLGITTIYASPIFKARSGSTHGYDVTNASELNPEIGTMAEFEALQQTVKQHNMSWLQDIVPNHMAFHPDNTWLMDVFEKGPASHYYNSFDINWNHPNPDYTGKVMAPFLGSTLADALEAGDIKIVFSEQGFFVQFYENQYPVSLQTWQELWQLISKVDAYKNDDFSAVFLKLKPFEKPEDLQNNEIENWAETKQETLKLITEKSGLREQILEGLEKLNQDKEKLKEVLNKQFFSLEHWQVTDERINYRRFFTINELICLRMEDQQVFEDYHAFILELCKKGYFQGLRIDHIDGLLDPPTYLDRLRKAVGENCYLTVEKILEMNEELPKNWPVQGTTGYYFLAVLNQLLTNTATRRRFSQLYKELVPNIPDYEAMVFEKKMHMLMHHMQGERDNLFTLLQELNLVPEKVEKEKIKEALQIFLAAFPVYRLYSNELPVTGQDAEILEKAFESANKHAPELEKELDFFKQLFHTKRTADPTSQNRLFFLMRCQQFTGPLAAKGVEDTTFYNYNWLISHNEVGDTPNVFGIETETFHTEMMKRQKEWPLAQNATATHDTKRGEDSRIRLNVLTELADEFEEKVKHWKTINQPLLHQIEGEQVPSPNREYFLYQVLLGAFPMDGNPDDDFAERIKESMTKAMREAKVYSNWTEPNEAYESGVHAFIDAILEPESEFMQSFKPFLQKLTFYGMIYSLNQALLKITAPGIPDIYQGTELWDLSLVDPDNRRPVDYDLRLKFQHQIEETQQKNKAEMIESLKAEWTTGHIKLFTIQKALQFRLQNQKLFTEGDYVPVYQRDKNGIEIAAFIRKHNQNWCLIAVPLSIVNLVSAGNFPVGAAVWENEELVLPDNAPSEWKNVFTNQKIYGKGTLFLAEVFESFPVAFLTSEIA